MTTIMKARSSADFLALVPALAGFMPHESLVLVPFRDNRAYGALRIDLPPESADPAAVAAELCAIAQSIPDTAGAAVIVYTDGAPAEGASADAAPRALPRSDLAEAAQAALETAGLRVVDALCVTGTGWGSYLDSDPELRPLDEIPATPAPTGVAIDADQEAGAALPEADLAERERVGQMLRMLEQHLAGPDAPAPGAPAGDAAPAAAMAEAVDALEDLPGLFERVLRTPEDASPQLFAAVLWALARPILRDVALIQWACDIGSGERVLDQQLASAAAGAPSPSGDPFSLMLIGRGPGPDAERLRRALRLTLELAARAPRDAQVAPLTLAAWFSWALGRATHAAIHLERVAAIDPDYGLADIVARLVHASVLPEWVLRRGAAGLT